MEFLVLDDPLKFYNVMLSDIALARKFIYLETYKFANDHMGVNSVMRSHARHTKVCR